MKIKSIYFENYKAFKTGKVQLTPLSVLLGTNSSGKSSIIKLILMLSQTLVGRKNTHLLTEGKFADLGELENLFWNQDTNKVLKFEFNIESLELDTILDQSAIAIKALITMLVRDYYDEYRFVEGEVDLDLRTAVYDLGRSNRNLYNSNPTLEEKLHSAELALKVLKKINKKSALIDKPINNNVLFEDETKENEVISPLLLKHTIDFIRDLQALGEINKFGYNFRFYKDKLIIDSVYFGSEKKQTSISFWNHKYKRKHLQINSNVFNTKKLDHYKSNFDCKLDRLTFSWANSINSNIRSMRDRKLLQKNGPAFILFHVLKEVFNKNINTLNPSNIKYVSPLRFYPKRYFLVEGGESDSFWDTFNGERLSAILNDNPELRDQINKWFKKFDLEIDVEKLKGMIHSIKVKDRGLTLDITDVGFGVSQILPVILQPYLSNDSGLTIIEQPEIHIHPKMQSELADFFVSLINTSDKHFLIETHSEAFLKRMRRRIAENNDDLPDSISNENVSIHFVEKGKNKKTPTHIKDVEIEKNGFFEWPEDFRVNDIEDTIEFMKYQG